MTSPSAITAPRAKEHGDPVVTTSPEVTARGHRRATAVIATGFFLLIVYGVAIVDLLAPVSAPQLVGFEQQQQAQLREQAHFSDGSLAKLIEQDLRSTSRVRRTALAIYSPLLLRVFDEAGTTHVAGSDGFLFRRDRIRVAQRPRDEVIGLVTGRIAALSRALRRLGTRVVAMPLPRKVVAMAAMAPHGIDAHPEYDHLLVASLQTAGVETVDLLPVFAADRGDPAYLAADTHWSSTGMLLAARAVAHAVLGAEPREPALQRVRSKNGPAMLAHALGLDPLAQRWLPAADFDQHYFVDRKVASVSSQPAATGPLPLLLAGTSFSKHMNDESTFFAEALSAMLGRPMWNGARAGATALQSLAQALARVQDRPLPATIVLELPNHYSLCFELPCNEVGEVFAQLPMPGNLVSLQHGLSDRFGIQGFVSGSNLLPGALAVQKTPPLLSRVPWDSFVYPRDGTVVVVLRGTTTAPLQLTVDTDASRIYQRWQPDRREVAVPIGGDRLGMRLDITASATIGEASLDLTAIDVACDLDLDHGRPGVPSQPEGPTTDGAHWHETFYFDGAPATADACVGIVIDGPAAAATSRQVDATFADGATVRLFGPTALQHSARMLLPLGVASRALRSVTVSGIGTPPLQPIRVWHLQRLPR